MRILITGGAGYIGTTLIPILLKRKYHVTVLDNLMFGGDPLLSFFRDKNFEFIKGDIRNKKDVIQAVKGKDIIVHLAAIVGFPACRKNPLLAKDVNINGTKTISKVLSRDQLVIFASTESNYGGIEEVVTEETHLHPLSLYAQTKARAEHHLLKNNSTIALRFATGFGVSPRMRLDSLINDFVFKALTQQYIVVYEKNFRRSFIHVYDMAHAIVFSMQKANIMKNQIYNVGSEKLNFTKEEICRLIQKYIKCYIHYAEIHSDVEKRNFQVSYKKIRKHGYKTTINIKQGIKELKSALRVVNPALSNVNI